MPTPRTRSDADVWVAIDFETATREPSSACALGIAIVRGGQVVERQSWLIQPPFNEYEFWNTKVHGLSAEDTALAPDFREVWFEVQPLLALGPLLAHNAGFDVRVLRALADSFELPMMRYEYVCTVAMARRAYPELRRHTLDAVCDHCGIHLMHHDAASDAEACAGVALVCAAACGAGSVTEAVELLGVSRKRM